MNIIVKTVDSKEFIARTGGGCSEVNIELTVDDGLPYILQIETVFHELIESFFPGLSHDKIIEFSELYREAVEQLLVKELPLTY